jgi:acyl-CoA dehydrogenase
VPNAACKIVDWAIQAFGGAGVTNDFGIAAAYATARLLRIADGADEVHRNQIGRLEMRRHRNQPPLAAMHDYAPGKPRSPAAEARRNRCT